MKSLMLLVLLFSFAPVTVGQTASINGTGGSASILVNTSGGIINLEVDKGTDANGNPSALLSIQIFANHPDGTTTIVMGFGNISNDAFTDEGPSKMNLNVDTSQVVGFSNTTCISTPFPNLGFTCSPSQGGPVQIAWNANGINGNTITQHSIKTTGPVTVKANSHGVFTSADAQGTVLGIAFTSTGSGFSNAISSDHTHTITITKN